MRLTTLVIVGTLLAACGGSGASAGAAPSPATSASGLAATASGPAKKTTEERAEAPRAAVATSKLKAAAKERALEVNGPATIAEFASISREVYPDPTYGVFIRYRHPEGLQADVFVYPGPDLATDCDLECARSLIKREIDGFPTAMQQQTTVKEYTTLSRASLTPGAGSRWQLGEHLHGRVHYGDRPHAQHTDYWLVYFPGYRLKVRSTFDETPERVALLEKFLAEVGTAYAGEPAVKVP